MSATMTRQGGRVQLEPSDLHLALNMAKMAKGGFLRAAIEEMQFLIKIPQDEVREEKKRGVEFPGHEHVKAGMERHQAVIWENQTDGCLPCQNGIAQNPHTRWRCKITGAPPPERLREPTPELTPHPPETPLVPPGNNKAAHPSEIQDMPTRYVYKHTPLPSAQFLNLDAYAKDHKRDKDFDPDSVTDEEGSTGQYTICCAVMQLTSRFQTIAANCANLTVQMTIDRMKGEF